MDGRTDNWIVRKAIKINKIDLKTALEQTDGRTKKRSQGKEKTEMHKINNLNIGIM